MRVNYKSDFDFLLDMRDSEGQEVGFPGCDFKVVLSSGVRQYVAECRGGVCTNMFNDAGRVHIVCDNHGLQCGTLMAKVWVDTPNAMYPDGHRLLVHPIDTGIVLVPGAGDTEGEWSVEATLPFVIVTAYDLAVNAGFDGSREDYERAAAELPSALDLANGIINGALGDLASGKAQVARALTQQGVPTDDNATFEAMADGVRALCLPTASEMMRQLGYATEDDTLGLAYWMDYALYLKERWQKVLSGEVRPDNWVDDTNVPFLPMVDMSRTTTFPKLNNLKVLRYLPAFDTSNIRDLGANMQSLELFKICLDFSSVESSVSYTFTGTKTRNVLLTNLGKSAMTGYNFNVLSQWGLGSDEARQSLVDTLLTYSWDRAAHGMSACTVQLAPAVKALLTAEEIAAITAKGYTIA